MSNANTTCMCRKSYRFDEFFISYGNGAIQRYSISKGNMISMVPLKYMHPFTIVQKVLVAYFETHMLSAI